MPLTGAHSKLHWVSCGREIPGVAHIRSEMCRAREDAALPFAYLFKEGSQGMLKGSGLLMATRHPGYPEDELGLA